MAPPDTAGPGGWRESFPPGLYRLEGREVVPCTRPGEFGPAFESADRQVALDFPAPGVSVSTIFVGIDHSWILAKRSPPPPGVKPEPKIFETLVRVDRRTWVERLIWRCYWVGHWRKRAAFERLINKSKIYWSTWDEAASGHRCVVELIGRWRGITWIDLRKLVENGP